MPKPSTPTTLLDFLVAALRAAADFNHHEMTAPVAVLWTDPAREWEAVLPGLRTRMPGLLTLGAFSAADKSGPAIWCKGVVGNPAGFGVDYPAGTVPVVYMPGIAKEQVRGVDSCPGSLRPIVELQYRGVIWAQVNGKDWTVRAFLSSSDGGLGLRIARDNDTSEMLQNSLVRLFGEDLAALSGKEIDASDLRQLVAPDPVSTLLRWINDPVGTRTRLGGPEWTVFAGECKRTYGFDPQTADVTKAGQALAGRKGAWAKVWERYCESPSNYPVMVEVLRRSKPINVLFSEADQFAFPQDNDDAETKLRGALLALADLPPHAARQEIERLAADHKARLETVWAKMGRAPLARAVIYLLDLAARSKRPLAGSTLADSVKAFAEEGWKTDAAAINALAAVETQPDHRAVGAAVRAVYADWLDASARAFQALAEENGGRAYTTPAGESLDGAGVLLFADGLRLDIARMLEVELHARGVSVRFSTRLAAIPAATPTAKPAVSPLSSLFTGDAETGDFNTILSETGKSVTSDVFKRLLPQVGFTLLGANETPDPSTRCWTEFGTLDKRGHSEQAGLAALVPAEVKGLADRIVHLLDAGAQQVKVVTDHGWLLLPGGLPKVEMPKSFVDTQWSRCASVKVNASVDQRTLPWRWNPLVQIASPAGAAAFRKGEEYAHGGISPQECVTPVLTVTRGNASGGGLRVRITSVRWNGLMAQVQIEGADGVMTLDVRLDGAVASTSVREPNSPNKLAPGQLGRVYITEDAPSSSENGEVVVIDAAGVVVARYSVDFPK
jgi:hypothetical protein